MSATLRGEKAKEPERLFSVQMPGCSRTSRHEAGRQAGHGMVRQDAGWSGRTRDGQANLRQDAGRHSINYYLLGTKIQ
jgi:hypothetical protein